MRNDKMHEYIKLIKDPAILIAIAIIFLIEAMMQLGCYKSFIKRNSYAANVNRITDHVLDQQTNLDPNILIVGTSLAYEGLSSKILNEHFSKFGLTVQSVAIPGADLIVQSLAVEKALRSFRNIKYIIHVNEAEMPWADTKYLTDSTLAMISEFDRSDVYREIYDFQYDVKISDLAFIGIKLITYRKDIGDFILNPDNRIKDIGRVRREKLNSGIYPYINENLKSLDMYSFENLDECIETTGKFSLISIDSDLMHRDAIYNTCLLAKYKQLSNGKTNLTELYQTRLKQLYKKFKQRNLQVINVFPPLPRYLDHVDYPGRIQFWKTEYSDILGDDIIDLYDSIPKEDGPKYFYDLVHMNQAGNKIFSERLALEIVRILENRGAK